MTSFEEVVARKFADVSTVSSSVGVFLAMVGSLARVNTQGSTVDVRCDGWSPPIPGMPVRVETVNGVMRVVGPSQTLAARGEVLESLDGGSRARVLVGDADFVLPVMAPYAPLVSDTVIINWMSGHVLGEEAAAPVTGAPEEASGGNVPFPPILIQPAASGKYDTNWDNWWSPPEVWASDNNKGCWFYSGRFSALAGANITRVEFFLPPPIRAVGAAYIGLHAYASQPGGEPTITDLVALPASARSGWIEVPASWGNYLRDNPGAGFGVTSGAGDNRWPGVGQAGGGQSGWVRFTGTR